MAARRGGNAREAARISNGVSKADAAITSGVVQGGDDI
jgi:hypothetical protein